MEKEKSGTLSTRSSIGDSIQPVESPDEDPWAIVDLVDNSEKWEGIRKLFNSFILIHYTIRCVSLLCFYADMSTKAKVIRVLSNIGKIIGAIGLLYFFICSLDLLSSAFRLISGKTAGKVKFLIARNWNHF
jgi:sodium-dependent phosphate cotransporter